MTLNINQFKQSPVKGEMDLQLNPTIIAGQLDVTSAGNLLPGTAVKMVDSAGGVPKFVEISAATDDVYGFLVYDIKKQNFDAYDAVQVACMRNSVMYMEASAAIARNAQVMPVVSGWKVATATSSQRIIGRAFDKAAADGDLIRVTIDLPGATA